MTEGTSGAGGPSQPSRPTQDGVLGFLALREVPWSLAYAGFLLFFVVFTTYFADIGYFAMAVALVGLALGSGQIRWPLPFWLLLAFWGWTALATSLSRYPGDTTAVIDLGKVMLVFLVGVNVLKHPLAVRLFLLLFVVCFALFPIRGAIFNYYLYQYADFGRPHWVKIFGNPNDLAAMSILALAVVTGFLHRDTPRLVRLGSFVACGVFPFVILLTQSRAGFIGLAAFLGLVILHLGRGARLKALVAAASLGLVVVATVPEDVWGRLAGLKYAARSDTLALVDQEGSAQQRWAIWETGLRVIRDHPGLGVGIGRYPLANEQYAPGLGRKDIHNTFLQVLAETGIPGLTLFLAYLASVIVTVRRALRDTRDFRASADWKRLQCLEFGLYGYLVAGIWGTYGFLSLLYIYLAALYAQSCAIQTRVANSSITLRQAAP